MPVTTFLFTDLEDSTKLWDEQPERMRRALAMHDLVARKAVSDHRGTLVKMTGDGMHAAFDDPLNAIATVVHSTRPRGQRIDARCRAAGTLRCACRCRGISRQRLLRSRSQSCGTHPHAAHGGQVLLSKPLRCSCATDCPPGSRCAISVWCACVAWPRRSGYTSCSMRSCARASRRCVRSPARRTICRSS